MAALQPAQNGQRDRPLGGEIANLDAQLGYIIEEHCKMKKNAEFIKELSQGDLTAGVSVIGGVKEAENSQESFFFSPNFACENWVEVPLSLVQDGSIKIVDEFRCKDHEHPIISFILIKPKSKDGAALYNILRHVLSPDLPNTLQAKAASNQVEEILIDYCDKDPSSPTHGSRMCCKYQRMERWPYFLPRGCKECGLCKALPNKLAPSWH